MLGRNEVGGAADPLSPLEALSRWEMCAYLFLEGSTRLLNHSAAGWTEATLQEGLPRAWDKQSPPSRRPPEDTPLWSKDCSADTGDAHEGRPLRRKGTEQVRGNVLSFSAALPGSHALEMINVYLSKTLGTEPLIYLSYNLKIQGFSESTPADWKLPA